MKVLVKACPRCGFVMLHSVVMLCRPGSAEDFGTECPSCHLTPLAGAFRATEIDVEEVSEREPDEAEIMRCIHRYAN